jgi:cyclase
VGFGVDVIVHSNRRNFIGAVLGGAAGLSLRRRRPLLAAQTAEIASTPLGENLFLLSGAGANVVARTGGGGVVMVDGGTAENSAALLDTVAGLPGGGAVETLFNTHWHPEQTGSNLTLGRAGARIVAHENTRLWLTTDITRPWENRTFQPPPDEARPNETFYTTGRMTIGGDRIEYGYMLQAHTDGDIYVFFPGPNVLVTGGLVSFENWPLVDWWTGGWINGMVDGIRILLDVCDRGTTIVPANGPVMTRADLEAQLTMYEEISGRLRAIMYNGRSPDDAIAERLTAPYPARLDGDADLFIRLAFESMWGHLTPDA